MSYAGGDHRVGDRRVGDRRVGDRGAAVVEFALVAVVLLFTFLSVLQVAVYAYVRNVLQADVAHTARIAAASGADTDAALRRVKELIAEELSDSIADGLTCTAGTRVDASSGYPTVTVRCRGPIRSLALPVGALLHVDVRASVLKEPEL